MQKATPRGDCDDSGTRSALRERARRDDPSSVIACADVEAWERAEGLASEAAAVAIRRRDVERFIPGLPARRTFMVLGWMTLAAFVLDSALAFVPQADWVDVLATWIRNGTAGVGIAVAGWSIMSEIRGWEGSDAATWFLKARIDRYRKKLDPRRAALRNTMIAIGADRLVVYRDEGGIILHDALAPEAVIDLSLETGPRHVTLQVTTREKFRRFEWLPRDPAFETAVAGFAGLAGGNAAQVTTSSA